MNADKDHRGGYLYMAGTLSPDSALKHGEARLQFNPLNLRYNHEAPCFRGKELHANKGKGRESSLLFRGQERDEPRNAQNTRKGNREEVCFSVYSVLLSIKLCAACANFSYACNRRSIACLCHSPSSILYPLRLRLCRVVYSAVRPACFGCGFAALGPFVVLPSTNRAN
jgi:hypothetical protein